MRPLFKPLFFLWPGSTGAVYYGLWSQLFIALIYGAVLQTLLVSNFYWLDFMPHFARVGSYVFLALTHLTLSAIAASKLKKYERTKNYDAQGRYFLEAQTHYLRGNWFETECCLKSVLKKNPYDVDALLMMATLFRHTERFEDARRTLRELEKLEDSDFWREEIALEKAAIRDDEASAREESKEEREFEAPPTKNAAPSAARESIQPIDQVETELDAALATESDRSILRHFVDASNHAHETTGDRKVA